MSNWWRGRRRPTWPLRNWWRTGAGKLAPFEVPRYIEYRLVDFPRTPSMRIQKEMLKRERESLTENAWDREARAHGGAARLMSDGAQTASTC